MLKYDGIRRDGLVGRFMSSCREVDANLLKSGYASLLFVFRFPVFNPMKESQMRLMKLFAVVFTVLSLAACASGTQYKHMSASMPKLQGDEGRIIFFRGASFAGVAVQPSIMLDGTKVGRSKPGGFFYVDTAAGPHEVTVTSDPDMKLAVTVDKGEVKYIKTSPAFGTMMGKVKFEIVPEADAMKQLPDLASNE